MPLLYKPRQSNVASLDGTHKWFPNLVKFKKQVSTKALAEQMAYGTTLAPGDVHHVLCSLPHYMFPHLLNSRTVRLEGLGTFTIKATASGNGVDTSKEVSPDQIKYLRVQFTPEYTVPKGVGKTRSQFANVEYELWGGGSTATTEKPGNGGDDDDDEWEDPNA